MQDTFQPLDFLLQILILLAQGKNLQVRQSLQPHVQNGLRLYITEGETIHKPLLGFFRGFAGTNEGDDFIQIVYSNDEAFQYVSLCLCTLQLEFRAASDYPLLMGDEVANHALQSHLHRLAVCNGHHVHAEGYLQVGILVQVIQHLLRISVLLQLDHGTEAGAVAFIPNVVNAAKDCFLLLTELQDFFQHGSLVDLIGYLGDAQQLAPCKTVLHVYPGTQA